MKTAQRIENNLTNENIFPLKVRSLRQEGWYLGMTNLCQNTHFTYKILQYTCYNWTYYTCSCVKWVWNISQYNTWTISICTISYIGWFWPGNIPTVYCSPIFTHLVTLFLYISQIRLSILPYCLLSEQVVPSFSPITISHSLTRDNSLECWEIRRRQTWCGSVVTTRDSYS